MSRHVQRHPVGPSFTTAEGKCFEMVARFVGWEFRCPCGEVRVSKYPGAKYCCEKCRSRYAKRAQRARKGRA
jgi:hypothetical protein